ncbi:MAG: hypothetical protein IJW55_09620 [Clostridia bacterium]|nr:hypothetical protein [Clostridia bacterium]
MKKLLCFTLSLLMLLALHIPAAATETGDPVTSSANLNDSLVSWWNFEGDKATAVLDKATNGTVADPLTATSKNTFDEATGTVTVPATKGQYLRVANKSTADLTNPSSMTVYLKAKYTGTNTDFADLIAFNNLYRIYKLKDSTSSDGAVFEACAFYTSGSNRMRPQTPKSVVIAEDQWFYLALTMEIDEAGTATAALYISTDGVNYIKNETYATTVTSLTLDETAIATLKGYTETNVYIGKKDGNQDVGIGYTFDDIRIYNKALTADEIESINMPTCVGYQVKDDTETDGSFSLRFLATVNSLDFAEVGFEITAAYGSDSKPFTKSCKYVYQSVNAANGSVTAESKGGDYLIALAITGIPEDVGEVTYTVKPFAKTSAEATPIYGDAVTVVHNIAAS